MAGSGKGPKVIVVGAGSMFFGRQAIAHMVTSDVLKGGTLGLVDTDEPTMKKMTKLAELAAEAAGAPTTIIGTTDRTEVLEGADFVILTFADRGIEFRGVDCEISNKYGVKMCSGDTIGPGGVFRTLREGPHVLDVARDVERLCPDAWVINLINPTAAIGKMLAKHTKVRSFALCDGHHEPHWTRGKLRTVGLLGEDQTDPALEARADIACTGVNHFMFLWRFLVDGKDYLPKYFEHLRGRVGADDDNTYSKGRMNARYTAELTEIFGAAPTAIGHTKEYVPYYQGWTVSPGLEPITIFDAVERAEKRKGIFEEIDAYIAGDKPMSEFLEQTPHDHATDIVEAMWAGSSQKFFINQPNRGAVSNLPDDAFLELRGSVDMENGPRPDPVGEMPLSIRGLQQQVLDTHELTADAVVTGDRRVLRQAMLVDPIVNSVSDADAMIAELLEAERDALPACWFE